MSNKDLAVALSATDALLNTASMDDVVEALRISCLMVAEHERHHGEIPMDRLFERLQTEEIDPDTEDLLLRGFQNLAGVLGTVMEFDAEESVKH